MRRALVLGALLALGGSVASGDEVFLQNGDRITGRVIGKVTRRLRLSTPFGTLVIPREKVEKIRHDDGTEELMVAPPPPAPPPPPPPPALVLSVSGDTFWQAWDPKAAPLDPSLRLEVTLDARVLATYTDANLDPEDLPKAVVNSFVYSPERLLVRAEAGVTASPPEVAAGEVHLRLRLPAERAGRHLLRLAYQANDASSAAPQWRDVVAAEAEIEPAVGRTLRLRLDQARGSMDFVRRRMRNVETFQLTLVSEGESPAP
jgi:hypothetical protein